jgi:hypothetical protein
MIYTYGCDSDNIKKKSKPVAGRFKMSQKDNRVIAIDDDLWSRRMKKYLNNAMVEKGQRGQLTCQGVFNKSINNSARKKKPKQQGMCACVCMCVRLYEGNGSYTFKRVFEVS